MYLPLELGFSQLKAGRIGVRDKGTLGPFLLSGSMGGRRAFLNVLLITHQSPLLIIHFIIITVAFTQHYSVVERSFLHSLYVAAA